MRGKKTGALLVALAVAVLLSSRGEKRNRLGFVRI